MSSMAMAIGRYQLENLLAQQTRFVYLDLRPNSAPADHALLRGSQKASLETAVAVVLAQAPGKDHPVVLICDDGLVSAQVAAVLESAGFINLFVVRGGLNAL